MPAITPDNFERIKNDVNGNGRYVIHFLRLLTDRQREHCQKWGHPECITLDTAYRIACKRANQFGGRKFNNKSYGGGIVFQSSSLDELCQILNAHLDRCNAPNL